MTPYTLSAYEYDLPSELIAQHPAVPRDSSRLMIIDRKTGNISEVVFRELVDLLDFGDSLVFNDTKVIPARLQGIRETGGKVEIFLLEKQKDKTWRALAKPARKIKIGSRITFSSQLTCQVLESYNEGMIRIQFDQVEEFNQLLKKHGEIPLPHYIQREKPEKLDNERYQTVYAKNQGAVAAPTAGLHFTQELLDGISTKGVNLSHVTLHVGLGTFKPVISSDIREHPMHEERYEITKETATQLNQRPPGKKQICVGTTTCRTLEAATNSQGKVCSGIGSTDIFIYPSYKFKYVNHLLTNFHLPGSTLLMLISAFAGYELTMEAYRKAVKDRFRFYSYGDAMLIL